MTRIELWVRRITGAVFIVAGIYYAAVYIFEALKILRHSREVP